MLKHNLTLIYRNFTRFKSTFLINLVGLSTGLACTLLIYLWAADEWNMDKFHNNSERLYTVMVNNPNSERIETSKSTQAILGEALLQDIPEVEKEVTTLGGNFDLTLSIDTRHIQQSGSLVGKDFFSIFSYEFLKGSPEQCLVDKKSIVLSERTAKGLFGDADAMGKTVAWSFPYGKGESTVTGVVKNVPSNSSAQFDFALPFALYIDFVGKESLHWGNFGCNTFLLLKPNTNVQAVNKKIVDFITKKSKDEKNLMTIFLTQYAHNYLYGSYQDGVESGGRIEYVRLFSLIGVFILVLACINFMNLSTAKATRRLKEVGVKKAIGAGRSTLIIQYLGESLLMTFTSMIIAVLLVDLLMPAFNVITGKEIELAPDIDLVISLITVTLVTGFLAGSYPALYLSGFSPATVLKGRLSTTGSTFEGFARKGLIVFQFAISILFIVAVWVIYKQIDFVQSVHLGYDKDNLIYIKPEGKAASNLDTYISEIKKLPGVENASSIARTIVGSRSSTVGYFNWEGKDPNAIIPFEIVNCNYDLIETLGVQMKEGRTFSREHGTDSASIVFNEAAIAVMNMKDPIGKIFNLWGKNLTIIGITKDFHFQSLHEKVKPLFFRLYPKDAEQIMVRLTAGQERETIAALGRLSKEFNPEFAFVFTFLDKDYQAQYNAEKRVSTLSKYFAGLAIVISCLGLFGLASFTAERRSKEIGIRKVMGSGEWRIIWMLSTDFAKMVMIASAIALPISYWFASRWLSGFAYRIPLSWWYFPIAGALALVIALITVGTQAVKASRLNPTQCLKEE
ncbi:MAG: FtsX-like permease family protein [Chryseolinea sp.]